MTAMNPKFGIWCLCIGALLLLIYFLKDHQIMGLKSAVNDKFLLNKQTPQESKLIDIIVTEVDHHLPNYDASTISQSRLNEQTPQQSKLLDAIVTEVDHHLLNYNASTISHSRLNIQTPQQPKLSGGIVTVVDHPLPNYDASTMSQRRLIVLPIFPLLNQAIYNKSRFVKSDAQYRHPSFDKVTPDKLEERMLDFLESLQHTLKHPLVSKVFILYDQDSLPGYLSNRIGMHPKLKLIRTSDAYSPFKTLEYVHNHLQNELVMITNADIYPGKGLEKLDYDLMKGKRLFYSPTRHGQNETRCKMPPEFCDPGVPYPGSHDAYIFIPSGSLRFDANSILSRYKWDSWGTENTILYMYQNHLKYKVLNPCKVIFLYHNHCSNLRRSLQTRMVPNPYSFSMPPSDKLE